jgi:hypothetical protein
MGDKKKRGGKRAYVRRPSLFIKGMQWGVITVYCTQGSETLVETGAGLGNS